MSLLLKNAGAWSDMSATDGGGGSSSKKQLALPLDGTLTPQVARLKGLDLGSLHKVTRVAVTLGTLPTTADATNHVVVRLTDGTASVDVPIDSLDERHITELYPGDEPTLGQVVQVDLVAVGTPDANPGADAVVIIDLEPIKGGVVSPYTGLPMTPVMRYYAGSLGDMDKNEEVTTWPDEQGTVPLELFSGSALFRPNHFGANRHGVLMRLPSTEFFTPDIGDGVFSNGIEAQPEYGVLFVGDWINYQAGVTTAENILHGFWTADRSTYAVRVNHLRNSGDGMNRGDIHTNGAWTDFNVGSIYAGYGERTALVSGLLTYDAQIYSLKTSGNAGADGGSLNYPLRRFSFSTTFDFIVGEIMVFSTFPNATQRGQLWTPVSNHWNL